MLGEHLRSGEPDRSFFSLSSHKEERVRERRPFGTPLSGSTSIELSGLRQHRSADFSPLPAVWAWPERGGLKSALLNSMAVLSGSLPARASQGESEPGFDRQFVISLISSAYWNKPKFEC